MVDLPDGLKGDAASFKGREVEGKVVSERISASALIPVHADNFATMRGVEDLENLKMRNENSEFHERVRRAFGWNDDTKEGLFEARMQPQRRKVKPVRDLLGFSEGAKVKDKKTGRKGIIIRASVGYTKKKHIPAHRIADKNGNLWNQSENNLKLLS